MASASQLTSRWNPSMRLKEAVQRRPLRSGILAGFAATILFSSIKNRYEEKKLEEEDKKTKKVLVLPFYKMKLVEETKPSPLSSLLSMDRTGNKTVEMSVDECVGLIHKAALDPQIVALYGIMGHGGGFSTGGWGHCEEIRNALLVFQQSHRRHLEPGKKARDENLPVKPMYLYTNSFSAPSPSGGVDMKEYYLASVFSHIHLQPQGDVSLFGLHTTNTFYRDFLAKYGITVHVWKHGQFKNFANQFTHNQFNKPHAENVYNIMKGVQEHVLSQIYESRYEQLKEYQPSTFWKMVHAAGSLPGTMAQKIGFVDYLPSINPLDDLIAYQKTDDDERTSMKAKWNIEDNKDAIPLTDFHHFPATKPISIMEYARKMKQKAKNDDQEWEMMERIQKLPSPFQSMLGFLSPSKADSTNVESDSIETEMEGRNEQIAVLKIGGPITDVTARKLEGPLRQLKKAKDKVKAVVVRVDSPGGAVTACETIHQQLQDLPQKVVVSFGNVSASGGYYISANSDRIFASPTTITGSIGVVMLRADLRGFANQWGIQFDSIATSELSGSFDPFFPMNGRMKENFGNFADRSYSHFKQLVSEGRKMDMDQVEKVAQGRVWTGTQAKEIGLVDELGGLDRAITYCQKNFTKNGNARVVAWPPKKSLIQALLDRKKNKDNEDDFENVEVPEMVVFAIEKLCIVPGVRSWLERQDIATTTLSSSSSDNRNNISSLENVLREGRLPMSMSGMMLTIDENAAIQCLLEQHDIPNAFSTLPPGFWEA